MQYHNNDTEAVRGGGEKEGKGVYLSLCTQRNPICIQYPIYIPWGRVDVIFIKSMCSQGIRLVPILVPDPDTRGQQDGVIISLTPTPITINIWSILQNKNNLTKHYQKKKLIESYPSF